MPEEILETPQSVQLTEPKPTNWPRIILAAVLGFGLLAACASAGYWYGTRKTRSTEVLVPPVVQEPDMQSEEEPSSGTEVAQVLDLINLSNAWGLGTEVYSNPEIGIAFEYPRYFTVNEIDTEKENREWAEKYPQPEVKKPRYRASFVVSLFTPEIQVPEAEDMIESANVFREICDNKMGVSVQKYDNSKKLSLFDFIADLNATYSGGGRTETFDTYKKYLTKTQLPTNDSYLFEGMIAENPVKEVYFTHKSVVYKFHLIGNCHTGGKYTTDAESVFDNILRSIKFL